MLARASSDAGIRLRRSKSTSTVHRHPAPISEPLDPDVAQQHALAAATAAFARAQILDQTDRKMKRSSEMSRSKSNASRKSLTSQGSHFPPRESSFRSLQPVKTGKTAGSRHQSRAPTMNTEQFPPFYPTPSSDRPSSVPRPLSAQPSISFSEHGRPRSQSKPHRQSAASSVTSQQIRKARSMYYASSIQTGSPIARPPTKYLTTSPPICVTPALEPAHVLPPTRTLRPSPLAGPRIPVTVAPDETVDKARDKYLQNFQQKTVKQKPSMFLAPFKKRQDKGKEKGRHVSSQIISTSRSSQRTIDESTAEFPLGELLPQPGMKEKRSFSGSIKSKFKRVFGRATNKSTNLPVQHIDASRDYFNTVRVNPQDADGAFTIPSPDEEILQRVRSRTPSLEGGRQAFIQSGSRSSSNGSAQSNGSNRSLHSETNATTLSASRVTSWGTSSTADTLTQRAIKRLTVIHEAKDSIGSQAEQVASMMPKKKPLPLPVLSAFRDPMPMESLKEESSTPIDPKRVFSALMHEIGSTKSSQTPLNLVSQTPGAESDVFESSETKELHLQGRELHSSASRHFRSSVSSDQRPTSRRPASVAAQSVQSKSSTIRSLGRAIRSTIRTVTPAEQRSSPCPGPTGSVRGAVRIPRDDVDSSSPTAISECDGSEAKHQPDSLEGGKLTDANHLAKHDQTVKIFTPSATQIGKRVERANCRWKTTLEDVEMPQFPRETDRTYNVTNFVQETTSHTPTNDSVDRIETSRNEVQELDRQDRHHFPTGSKFQTSPKPHTVMSPMSPSIYSRNTDGMSIVPNDSVMSLVDLEEPERVHDGGSAVILTSQSVRSYVIGTPSPRRPDSTRTSRDWKAWLSHEISGMEFTSQEDLKIHQRYTTPIGRHHRDITRSSQTDHDDTTVIMREICDTSTLMPEVKTPTMPDASELSELPKTQDQSHQHYTPNSKAIVPVLERSESHPDTFKEVSPGHTPTLPVPVEDLSRRLSSRPGSTPLSSRQCLQTTPDQGVSASQGVLEISTSSRMNDRFPFIDTGRRSSSNSARSSRQSKSPADSIGSSKSLKSYKTAPNPKIYSDLSTLATNQISQRVSNTALKRSDAQHRRKENVTPPSLRDSSKPNVSPAASDSRPKTLHTLSSATLDFNLHNVGQYTTNAPEMKHSKHNSSPAATPARPRTRVMLRPLSPEKLARRPRSAFDLRETTPRYPLQATGRSNIIGICTLSPRPSSELRHSGLHLKSSSNSLALNKEPSPGAEERVIDNVLDDERTGSVTPGQRMAERFLKERKSTTMIEGGKMRGGLRLAREDTPAFL